MTAQICQWCGRLALTKVEVAPPVIRKVPEPIIVKPPVEAWACAGHAQMVQLETLRAERDHLRKKRRRTATDTARLAELELEVRT